jgi:hypothetical protein
MAGSAQVTVTSSAAVLLAAAPLAAYAGQTGWTCLSNGAGGKVWIGGPGVTSGSGVALAASAVLSIPLFSGDQVYGIADSASSVMSVLTTGG